MSRSEGPSLARLALGGVFVVLGLAVFAIRFQHDGAYAMPRGGNLFGGVGSLVLGGALLARALPRPGVWIALALAPFVLFRGVYAIASEVEEVISLYATDSAGDAAELRLWIIDRDDGAWIGMPRTKAVEHALDGEPHEMLRNGEKSCVVPAVVEDREIVRSVHRQKVEKYAVARLAAGAGLYAREAPETTVAVRVDPCPPGVPTR